MNQLVWEATATDSGFTCNAMVLAPNLCILGFFNSSVAKFLKTLFSFLGFIFSYFF